MYIRPSPACIEQAAAGTFLHYESEHTLTLLTQSVYTFLHRLVTVVFYVTHFVFARHRLRIKRNDLIKGLFYIWNEEVNIMI